MDVGEVGTRAVLFDWVGTLVQAPAIEWRVAAALRLVGGEPDSTEVGAVAARLTSAGSLPELAEALEWADRSRDSHWEAYRLLYERAGVDEKLARALYDRDEDTGAYPLYSDATATLRALHIEHIRCVVVSDIHVDVRRMAASYGIDQYIDDYILSYELGYQKPDIRMFETALHAAGVDPGAALMVGDRHTHDGAASLLGINCLILGSPPPTSGPRGLQAVLRLAGVPLN